MRKVYPSKASFSQYLPSMLTKIPWGLWGMRAEAHNIAIAWMQSVAVALIWWQRVWWISRVSWQTQQISGVLEVWSWWSSPSPPPSSSPTWAMIFPVLTARATSLHCWRSNRPKVVQFDICPVFTIEDVLLCVTVVMTNRNWSKQWHCRWRGVNIVVLRQFRMFLGKRPRASIQQLVTPWPPCSPPRMGTGQQKGCLAQKLLTAGNDWRKRTSERGAKTWFVPRYLALTKDVVWRCQMMCKGVFYPP